MEPAAVEARLRAEGCSVTAQRRAIVLFLHDNPTHPTAGDVLAAVTREHPQASRATVYNTLALLLRVGAVRVLPHEAGEARYDPNLRPHHHAVCPTCGVLQDVPEESVEVLLNGLRTPAAVRFELPCAACPPTRGPNSHR